VAMWKRQRLMHRDAARIATPNFEEMSHQTGAHARLWTGLGMPGASRTPDKKTCTSVPSWQVSCERDGAQEHEKIGMQNIGQDMPCLRGNPSTGGGWWKSCTKYRL